MSHWIVIARSNGHEWIAYREYICCKNCGAVRRADDNNSKCRGKVRVAVRAQECEQ